MLLKSKKHHKLLPALLLAALSLWPALPPVQAAAPSLPVLNWQQRSDWINVKTSVTPKAIGDGVHDDTAALQAGLNHISRGYFGAKTLYLPAGTYRISKTLTLSKIYGAAIIGQGQATRIVWNGPLGQSMYVSDGVCRSRYVGVIWDGANKAGVGIDHQSRTIYETFIRHQDEAFVNFKTSGIRVGYNQVVPTSEVTYRNCLFQNNASGVTFLTANDYNNNFTGCEFQDNNIAINCVVGNVYVRDCHFERSRTVDILLSNHAHSIRRCTSVGSKQFIFVPTRGGGCAVTAEDCHVDGWTGSGGAMAFGMFGPTTIMDCVFTHPPDSKAPVRLTNPVNCIQPVLLSNNSAPSSAMLVKQDTNVLISELPAGARGPSLSDPHQSFLKSSEAVPTTILDVRMNFGAKGDNVTDDTAAISSALSAAKAQGGNAVVYFPEGIYHVSKTLPIAGGNYTVEGCGCQTTIRWIGPHGGVVFSVQDPQRIALKDMLINAPKDTACVQQTSVGAASSQMTYEQLSVGGGRGLECIGLPSNSTVHLDDFDGSTHFTDCSRAVILGEFVSGGVLQVDGADYEKTGFLGILAHNDCANAFDVIVRDNQDLVGTNFYTEETTSALSVNGNGAMPGQPGHVTIQGSKTQTIAPTAIKVDDYEGRVTYAGAGLWSSPVQAPLAHSGNRPVDLVLLGNSLNGVVPNFTFGAGAKLTSIANFALGNPRLGICQLPTFLSGTSSTADDSLLSDDAPGGAGSEALLAPAVAALDDFRQLGAYDLAINYP